MFTSSAKTIIDGIRLWRERDKETKEEREAKETAIKSVFDAVLSTKAYLYDLHILGSSSRSMEILLSEKWQKAAMDIRHYDHQLADGARLKAMGWADPREWEKAKDKKHLISKNRT